MCVLCVCSELLDLDTSSYNTISVFDRPGLKLIGQVRVKPGSRSEISRAGSALRPEVQRLYGRKCVGVEQCNWAFLVWYQVPHHMLAIMPFSRKIIYIPDF